MENNCKEIIELLVEYSDGELPATEAEKVTHHLQECRNCQNTLNALQKSLRLAETVWEKGLSEIHLIQISTKIKTGKSQWARYAAVAAIVLIAASFFVMQRQGTKKAEKEITFAEIEHRITEEGNAARLLAAADLLPKSPDIKQIIENQYRYILEQYPQTKAALQAKTRIEEIMKGDTK